MEKIKKAAAILCLAVVLFCVDAGASLATSRYASETGQPCLSCHEEGSSRLNAFGEAYRANGYRWPGAGTEATGPNTGSRPWLPLALQFIHLLSAVSWIGAIFFIHLILSPKAVQRGIPQAEIRLAWANIGILTLTGIYLTAQRIGSLPELTGTTFGRLLLLKLALFMFMVATATLVTLRLNKKLQAVETAGAGDDRVLPPGLTLYNAEDLAKHNGEEGKSSFILFQGLIYDVSASKMWKNGTHARRHHAGTNLSGSLGDAPHGDSVLNRFPVVGQVEGVQAAQGKPPAVRRFFLLLANANLIFGVAILFITVLWNYL